MKKTLGPATIFAVFVAIAALTFGFYREKTADLLAFYILLIAFSPFFADLLVTDLLALLISIVSLIGISFVEGYSRLIIVVEIATAWGIVWILHLLNDRAKYHTAENSRILEQVRKDISKTEQDLALNRQKMKNLSARIEQYKTLTAATKEISKSLSIPELKDRLLKVITEVMKPEKLRITTFLPTDDQPPDAFDAWVVKKQSILLITNTIKDYRFDMQSIPKGIKSIIAAPLFQEKNIIGIIRLESSEENRFTQQDLSVLNILLDISGLTIENLMLLEKAKALSITDALTGLYVRKFFDERIEQEINRSARFQKPLCLVLCDIDHFKKFNDTYGHQAGDDALKVFSHILRNSVRETDIAARYGGEEFAVILPETGIEDAVKIAENIRMEFQRTPIQDKNLSGSFGIAFYPQDAASHSQIIRKADERLYKAKQAGRNITVWKD